MCKRVLAWLLLGVLCAGCVGGQPPAAPTRAGASPSAPVIAPAPEVTLNFAPATPPAATTLALSPTLAATGTLTSPAGLITAASAVSVTEAAVLATGKTDQVAWSPDGTLLAAAGANGVTLYDSATLSVTQPLNIGQWATSLAFDPRGDNLAVGTVGAIVQVWNLARLEPTTLLVGPGTQVKQVAYNPAGGALLASLGVDNRAHLWNVNAQEYLRELGSGQRPAYALAYQREGDWLATAEGDRVLLWEVRVAIGGQAPTPRSLPAPAGRGGAVTAVAFSPAAPGDQLAAANTSGSIELWQLDAAQPALSLARLNTPAAWLAYSPDGAVLASAHQDRAIRLWDTHSGALLATLAGHAETVTCLAFSPDGTRLASSSWDGTVRVWALPNGVVNP